MARPEIRPAAFIALQNAMAASFFALLLAADMLRRLLDKQPESELLWQLSTLANRTVMPVLRMADELVPDPDRLVLVLIAGVVIPLLAWWTRYWFATAVAGHVMLAALIIMGFWSFRRTNLDVAMLHPDAMVVSRIDTSALVFLTLGLLMLVMCLADHWAFWRFLRSLWTRWRHRAAG